MQLLSYRDILKNKLTARTQSNQAYSLRALARSLNTDPSQISRIISGKRHISVTTARLYAEKLFDLEKDRDIFVSLVEFERSKNSKVKEILAKRIEKLTHKQSVSNLALDKFNTIANWYHFAILDMTFLKNFDHKISTFSKKLGITQLQVKIAVDRLIRLELLTLKNGKFIKTQKKIATPTDVPNPGLREFHKQMLAKATEAIESQSVDKRYFIGKTICIDKKMIPELKRLVEQFSSEVEEVISKSKEYNSIYQVNVQVFDLLKGEGS